MPAEAILPLNALAAADKAQPEFGFMGLEGFEERIFALEPHKIEAPPLGSDTHAVADNQNPQHQSGIDRRAADAAVQRLQFRAHLLEIEKSVNASEQVIVRDVVIEAEIVKSASPSSSRSSAKQHEDGITSTNADQPQTNQQYRRNADLRVVDDTERRLRPTKHVAVAV